MHRPVGPQVTSGLGTQLSVQSCMEGRQAATACCLVVLGGLGLEQKDQYRPPHFQMRRPRPEEGWP